jgi:hypothetical protein
VIGDSLPKYRLGSVFYQEIVAAVAASHFQLALVGKIQVGIVIT